MNDFPESWRFGKNETASLISQFIDNNSDVFSFGFGTGHVENRLSQLRPGLDFYLFDFCHESSRWIGLNPNLKVLKTIAEAGLVDVILCVQVFYSLSDTECRKIIHSFKSVLKPSTSILVVETSAIPRENGIDLALVRAWKIYVVSIVYSLYLKIFRKKGLQFWGWRRSNQQIANFFAEQGFYITKQASGCKQSVLEFRLHARSEEEIGGTLNCEKL